MDRTGPDPQHPNVVRLKEHQSRAFEHLNEALSVDESQTSLEGKAGAVAHYKMGIKELEAGVALYLPTDPADPGLDRAHTLKRKMEGNLETARERLTFLSTSLHLNSLSLAEPQVRFQLNLKNFKKHEMISNLISRSLRADQPASTPHIKLVPSGPLARLHHPTQPQGATGRRN